MANNEVQAVFKSSPPRVQDATQKELEDAADALMRHTHILVNDWSGRIARVSSKYSDDVFFDAYRLAAEHKSSDEITKELALALTEGFGLAYISPRYFKVEELESIIAGLYYTEMAK